MNFLRNFLFGAVSLLACGMAIAQENKGPFYQSPLYFNDTASSALPVSGGYLASVNGVMTWVSPFYTSTLFGGKYAGDATRPWITGPVGLGYTFSTTGAKQPNLRIQRSQNTNGSTGASDNTLSILDIVGNQYTTPVTVLPIQVFCNSTSPGAGLCNPIQTEADRGTAPISGVATFTGSSATIAWSGASQLVAGQEVAFTTTGALPGEFSLGSGYFVISTGLTASTFQLSATFGGGAITPSGAGTGTTTASVLFQSSLFGGNSVSKDQQARKSSLSGSQIGWEFDLVKAGPDDLTGGGDVIQDIIGREQFGPSPDGPTTIVHGNRVRPSNNITNVTGPATIVRGFESTSSTAYPGASVTNGLWSDSASYGISLSSSSNPAITMASSAAGINTVIFSNDPGTTGFLQGIKLGDLLCETSNCTSPVSIPAGTTVTAIINSGTTTTLTLSNNLAGSGIANGANLYAVAVYVDGSLLTGWYSDALANWASQFGQEFKVLNGLQIGSPTGGTKGVGTVNAANGLYTNGVLLAPPVALVTTGLQYFEIWPSVSLAATTVAPTQNTARCAPFNVYAAFHTDQVAMQVSTLGVGPLNFALYTDAVDATTHKHQPQTPITNPNVTLAVSSTGLQSSALGTGGVGVPLAVGLNWACINNTNVTDVVRFIGINSASTGISGLIGITSASIAVSGSQLTSLTIAETAGTTITNWPSLVGQTMVESNTTSIPNFALRIATVP